MKDLVKVRVHAVNAQSDGARRGYPQAVSCVIEIEKEGVQNNKVDAKIKEFEALGNEKIKMLVEVVKEGDKPSWEN